MDGYRPLTLARPAYLGWVAAVAGYLIVGLLLKFNLLSGVLTPLLVGAVLVLFAFGTIARLADAGWHPRAAALIVLLAVTVVPLFLALALEQRWDIPIWTIVSDLGLMTLILIWPVAALIAWAATRPKAEPTRQRS